MSFLLGLVMLSSTGAMEAHVSRYSSAQECHAAEFHAVERGHKVAIRCIQTTPNV